MTTIYIDRSIPISETFLPAHEGWCILEQDERSAALTEVNLDDIVFYNVFREGEEEIDAVERRKRLLDSGNILLDIQILEKLLSDTSCIPESWKVAQPDGGSTYIMFDGTIIAHGEDKHEPTTFFLYWSTLYKKEGEWRWVAESAAYPANRNLVSAVILKKR